MLNYAGEYLQNWEVVKLFRNHDNYKLKRVHVDRTHHLGGQVFKSQPGAETVPMVIDLMVT